MIEPISHSKSEKPQVQRPFNVAVIGGAGHVGLPFGLVLCDFGHRVTLVDTNAAQLERICQGNMPFEERGADSLLPCCLESGRLHCATGMNVLSDQEIVIVTIGTPVDEYLDPSLRAFDQVLEQIFDHCRPGQLLIVRSTVFPGVTERLGRIVKERGLEIDVSYCPERIAQGLALEELTHLPQLVSGCTDQALERATEFFADLGLETIPLSTVEAELGKLYTNSYRYINFAISNQFYMLAQRYEADFDRIYQAITHNYKRMNGFARAGFAGGPCLLKDTMQLASFNHNLLTLGQTAMEVNEGLPGFVVERLKQNHDLTTATVGILGMAFKGNCDDPRSSLSYKLRKVLTLDCRRVLCTDPFIQNPDFVSVETLLAEADILILGACHDEYRELQTDKPLIDVFGFLPGKQP